MSEGMQKLLRSGKIASLVLMVASTILSAMAISMGKEAFQKENWLLLVVWIVFVVFNLRNFFKGYQNFKELDRISGILKTDGESEAVRVIKDSANPIIKKFLDKGDKE